MNLVDLEMVIYDLCDNNDVEDVDELEELHHKIVEAVDNDIEDFDISLL